MATTHAGAELGELLKIDGIERASESKASLLAFARGLAVEIARRRADRTCTADDVQAELPRRGISDRALGRAAGALFKGRDWEWTGEFVTSERAHGHGNLIRRWRYVGGDQVRQVATPPADRPIGRGEGRSTAIAGRGESAAKTQAMLFEIPYRMPD